MAPDAACAKVFTDGVAAGNLNITQYVYHGPVQGIYQGVKDPPPFISYAGCQALCGTDAAYYDWAQISATISTWVLPAVGLIVQAPFESNAFWKTVFATTHWIGSPISSLSAILWNTKVFAKCSLIVDMATPFSEVPGEDSQYSEVRDSFYILSVMNQFSIQQAMPRVEAERLLRIALFSDNLQLEMKETCSIVDRRRKLARMLRDNRKKGIVPVFISLWWFLFSLGSSVQQCRYSLTIKPLFRLIGVAFSQLGYNASAHNLALGLLLAWLPVWTLCSIVDRNPTDSDAVRNKLNKLIDAVRKALLNPDLEETYIKHIGRNQRSFQWTENLGDDEFQEDFFTRFAGQGRVRWHYGIAHGILSGIEESYVAEKGRYWLEDGKEARSALVRGPKEMQGLVHREFNLGELWQLLSSFLIVSISVFGAFILSYETPTIGLSCRSGGYLIFFVLACAILLIELLCWYCLPAESVWDNNPMVRIGSRLQRTLSQGQKPRLLRLTEKFVWWWERSSKRDMVDVLILRPLECVNTLWLTYIVGAQTIGSYNTCSCQCSVWGPNASYMDFESQDYYLQLGVGWIWGVSTGIVCAPMALAFGYIVAKWCMSSHLSTVDYESARAGLLVTRKFRRIIFPFLHLLRGIKTVLLIWRKGSRRPYTIWRSTMSSKKAEADKTTKPKRKDTSATNYSSTSTYGLTNLEKDKDIAI